MKRIVALFAVLLFLGSLTCFAAESEVVDQAGVLTSAEERELQEKVEAFEERFGLTAVLLTVDDYKPYRKIETYADTYYDNHGYPEGGLLFVVAVEAREYYSLTTGDAISRFSDNMLDEMGDRAARYLSSGEYGKAFSRYMEAADDLLSARGSDPLPGAAKKRSPYALLFVLGSVVLSFLIGLIVAGVQRAKMKSVRAADSANAYIRPGSFALTRSREVFLYKTVTRVAIQSSGGGGGGGGSSTHRAPSGHTHGGRGGRF